MKVLMYFLSSLVFSAPFSSPSLANSISEQIEINFLSEKNWIEINRIERTPEVLDIDLRHVNGKLTHIASFNQEGPAPAELVTVFNGSGNFRSDIFVVIKWYYNLPGVDTDGNFYEVHAYEAKKIIIKSNFPKTKKYQTFSDRDSMVDKKEKLCDLNIKMNHQLEEN